jgi:hypothetical protein
MKRKITLSIALVVSIISVLLMNSDSSVEAQNQIRGVGDTGTLSLGPNQILRVSAGALPSGLNVVIRFRQIKYEPTTVEQGITSLAVVSQTTSNAITLMPDEAATFDISDGNSNTAFVRGAVLSNQRDVKVNASIINSVTGQVDAIIDASGYFAP